MAKEEHEDKGQKNKLVLDVIVSGTLTEVTANINAPLRTVIEKALEQTGNDTGRPVEEWVLKDADQRELDPSQKIEDFGFAEHTKLFLSPNVGAGG